MPTNLSVQELRIAQNNLPEEQQTAQAIQIITERLLSRLSKEKNTIKTSLTATSPVMRLENSFEDFWHYYPKTYDRASTYQVWLDTLARGISAVDLVCAAQKYALAMKTQQTLECYITSSRNFLLNNKFWKFLPTYLASCPHCKGKGIFAKANTMGELEHYRCNCHQRYQHLTEEILVTKASA